MSSQPVDLPLAGTFSEPMDAATAETALAADAEPHCWPLGLRVGFRLAFSYLAIWCLFNGNATVFGSIPVLGDAIQDVVARVFLLPAQSLAQHLFHVPAPGNTIHPTGSGDTAIDWIAHLLFLVVALVATLVWSVLDRQRPHYQTLSAWLRFLIRLTIGFGMVTYGVDKVFPMQMPMPSIASLSEPLGMHSPMAVLWNFIGANPIYEMICGGAELLAGLLLLFRRTALFGALLTAFVVTNVLLYNLCFDVPVKLYAGHLLLLSLFVILPDIRPLFRFFWLHEAAAPTGVWVPPGTRPWFRRTTIAIEIVFAILAIGGVCFEVYPRWQTVHASRMAPCPLRGAWRIDSATLADSKGSRIDHPLLSSEYRRFVELDIDTNTRAFFRDDLGRNWQFQTVNDTGRQTLQFIRPDKSTATFTVARDGSRLVLTPTGAWATGASTLTLTLVSPPNGYPLMTRGFHWVSEYPYQR